MPDAQDLMNLPYDLLAVLAIGYVGYRLAYVGRDAAHQTFDRALLVTVFSTIARLSSDTIAALCDGTGWWVTAVAALLSVAAALFWRVLGSDWTYRGLRWARISSDDGQPSAWRSMLSRKMSGPVQLTVITKTGKVYLCDDLHRFNDAPMGPCLLGEDGSIAMYITDWRDTGEAEWREGTPFREDAGYEMSFFPATEIQRVDIARHG